MLQTQLSTNKNVGFMDISTFENAYKWGELISKSDVVPKEYRNNAANILVAAQSGMELGLGFMQSIQGGMVINGRYSVFGDTMLAVCMRSPDFVDCIEEFDEKNQTATCTVMRNGRASIISPFSIEDAVKAFLVTKKEEGKDFKYIGKEGPWRLYTKRMLKMRARSFALRDMFPDVLKGIISVEEARDIKDVNESTVAPPTSNEVEDRLKSKFKSDEKVPFEIIEGETIEQIEAENEVTTTEVKNDE